MKLVIDNREPLELINLIKSNLNINVELSNLDIGDFHIYEDNNIDPIIIIERKSLSDLISSIKDGRYREQSFRLDQYNLHNHNIYYLLEGSIEYLKNPLNKQIIYSSILTLSYYKGFSVINSLNINQTSNIIIKFIEKLMRENKKGYYNLDVSHNNLSEYSAVLKTSKKSNITKDNILEIMLMQIPLVSIKVAKMISEKYKTIKNLIDKLENDETILDNLTYDTDSQRKLSKNTIKNIKEYLILN